MFQQPTASNIHAAYQQATNAGAHHHLSPMDEDFDLDFELGVNTALPASSPFSSTHPSPPPASPRHRVPPSASQASFASSTSSIRKRKYVKTTFPAGKKIQPVRRATRLFSVAFKNRLKEMQSRCREMVAEFPCLKDFRPIPEIRECSDIEAFGSLVQQTYTTFQAHHRALSSARLEFDQLEATLSQLGERPKVASSFLKSHCSTPQLYQQMVRKELKKAEKRVLEEEKPVGQTDEDFIEEFNQGARDINNFVVSDDEEDDDDDYVEPEEE